MQATQVNATVYQAGNFDSIKPGSLIYVPQVQISGKGLNKKGEPVLYLKWYCDGPIILQDALGNVIENPTGITLQPSYLTPLSAIEGQYQNAVMSNKGYISLLAVTGNVAGTVYTISNKEAEIRMKDKGIASVEDLPHYWFEEYTLKNPLDRLAANQASTQAQTANNTVSRGIGDAMSSSLASMFGFKH